jgi:twinkle protein
VSSDITALAHQGYTEFYIDHLTAFAAHAQDERKMLEATCADMAMLAQRLGVRFYVISHLSTPEGKPHEEGGRVFIKHFKGSRAIGFWAHFMFGIERDTQAEDVEVQKRGLFRCLKDRYTGSATGKHLTMLYDIESGLQSVDNDWVWPTDGEKASGHGFTSHETTEF